MTAPDVDYLSASLQLTESGNGEVRELHVGPLFDHPRIEITIVEHIGGDEEACISLNARQIECLVDFLDAWLARLKIANAVNHKP